MEVLDGQAIVYDHIYQDWLVLAEGGVLEQKVRICLTGGNYQ